MRGKDSSKVLFKGLIIMVLLFCLMLGHSSPLLATNPLDVVINEVAWMGTQASSADEWIELYNTTDQDIDLTGWTLEAADGTPSIALSGMIPAHGYFLLERTDDSTVSDILADQIYTGALKNGGEALTLKDPSDNVIDTANGDGGAWPAGDNTTKSTMERIDPLASDSDANWATNDGIHRNGLDANGNPIDGTPKAQNSTVNTPPIADAGPDQIVNENALVTLDGSGSFDPDSDPLTYNWTQTAGPAVTLSDTTAVQPTFTAPSVRPSGALLTFQLTVDDGRGGTDSDSVNITVNNVNQAPTCNDISVSMDEDTRVDIDLASYCTDPDGDPLTGSFVSDPPNGTAQFLSPTIRYTPDPDYNGSDSFQFRVTDGQDESNTATVNVTVNPINDPPIADDHSVSTLEDTVVDITLTGSDVDGDTLTFSIVSGPSNGTLSSTPPNVTYTPNPNFNGPDSFTFQVDDGHGGADTGTVSITVTPVNDAPSCSDISVSTDEDTPVDIDLALHCTDPDGDALTGSFVSDPDHGTAQFLSPTIRYTPDPDFHGDDSFTFRVSDDELESNTATVNVTVNEVNDDPVADAGADQAADEGDPVTLDGSGSSDPDSDLLTCTWDPGDGSPPLDGCIVIHAYADNGDYTATLTVDDGRGGTDSDTALITVANVPPTVEAGPDQMVDVGQAVNFNSSFADPGAADTHIIEWDFGDGDTARGALTPTHSYSAAGVYTVTLTVTDDDGGVGQDTLTVTVNAPVLEATKRDTDPTGPPLYAGEELEYVVELTNTGNAAQPDNPENEYEDPIPTDASFVEGSLAATSGTAAFDATNNRVVWNGALAPGETVTIRFRVQIGKVATGTTVANQGTTLFDADGDGANESTRPTDDPDTPEPGDPTRSSEVVRRGDPSGDGKIDLQDAVFCAKAALGLEDPTDLEAAACDVVPPCGGIDARDVVRIAEVALGIKDEGAFTCGGGAGEGLGMTTPSSAYRSKRTQLRIADEEVLPGGRAIIEVSSSAALEGVQVGPKGSLSFDPKIIQIKEIRGISPFRVLVSEIDNEAGEAKFMVIAMGGEPRGGEIIELEVEAVGWEGESTVIEFLPDMVLDAGGSELEAEITDGRLTIGQATPLRVERVLSTPNPVRDSGVKFLVEGQGIKDVQIQIYDLSGREVVASGWVPGETFEWNLMGNRGQLVANGVYLYIVTVRGFGEDKFIRSRVKKLVVLR